MLESLIGKSLEELTEIVTSLGMPKFTGGQIAKWLYGAHVTSIEEMTNISKANRQKLSERYTIGVMPYKEELTSRDGTKKYLFPVSKKEEGDREKYIESVYIPDKERATLCVSCDELPILPDRQAGLRRVADRRRHYQPDIFPARQGEAYQHRLHGTG